jgi:hypothetical protein
MTDDEYNTVVRQMNNALKNGWTPTFNSWTVLGTAIAKRQAARDQPIWGVRERYAEISGREVLAPMQVALVANAWAFHPLATPIRDVTYDEAIALHKLKN